MMTAENPGSYFGRSVVGLGDVNGDRKVDATDANLILAGMSKPFSRELDINGDMMVNNTDRGWTQRSNGRKLKDGLFLND